MKQDGFGNFVGIDASKVMLEEAQKKGLYQDLKQCLLGELPLPVQKGSVIMSKTYGTCFILYLLTMNKKAMLDVNGAIKFSFKKKKAKRWLI